MKLIKSLFRKIKTFYSFEKPLWVLEAIFLLIISKMILFLFPFKWVTNLMGELMKESSYEKRVDKSQLKILSESIIIADRNIPFETACYTQALTGKIMLNRQKLKSTLYLGVLKNEEGITKGHAWLRHGDFIVTGKKRHNDYQVIATYS